MTTTRDFSAQGGGQSVTNGKNEVITKEEKVGPVGQPNDETSAVVPTEKNIQTADIKVPAQYRRESNKSVNVRLLTTQKYDVGGNSKLFVVTEDEPLRGFLVDEDKIEYNSKKIQSINPDEHTEVYNWASELAKIFESIEKVRKNALLSFWRSGAFDKSVLSNASIRKSMFQSAFPYAIEE